MPGEIQRLEAIKRQLEAQNEEWERIKAALLRLGDICAEVPREMLEDLDATSNPRPQVSSAGFRG